MMVVVARGQNATVPIRVAFHWHLHQPIYYPYESVVETIQENRFGYGPYGFSLLDVFTSRVGPYTGWPVDAVQAAQQAGLGHCGAQVSFTGALQENLNNLQGSSVTTSFNGWQSRWLFAQQSLHTSMGNPALYFTAFGYHHPLMTLVSDTNTYTNNSQQDTSIIKTQILLHRLALSKTFNVSESSFPRGIFPPENSFSERMIPALVDAGLDWVLVDNIHFDRAHMNYPWTIGSNLYPPNPADQRNNQTTFWLQLDNLWAPGKVSAPFGYRPYYVQHTDPETGDVSKIIAFPGARYEGVEDGRGGYGALLYDQVMSQYAFANTDPTRPMVVLMAHDGDNYGGGTESYYHENFDNFISWIQKYSASFECTTVEDYLQRFPVPEQDIIHVEDGSWSGADNGDPQFMKWDPDFFNPKYDPERNSFAVLTAAINRMLTANSIQPWQVLDNILMGQGSNTEMAFHFFLCGQASDYEYWPTEQIWNSDPTLAVNQAMTYADQVIADGKDSIGPTIFLPQRQYWNPGAVNWNPSQPDPSDFGIWTTIYDVSDVTSAVLNLRITAGQLYPTQAQLLYSGGTWTTIEMVRVPLSGSLAPQTDPLPTYIGDLFQANVTGITNSLIDYYVSATDGQGNISKSPLQHVYVADASSQ